MRLQGAIRGVANRFALDFDLSVMFSYHFIDEVQPLPRSRPVFSLGQFPLVGVIESQALFALARGYPDAVVRDGEAASEANGISENLNESMAVGQSVSTERVLHAVMNQVINRVLEVRLGRFNNRRRCV